MIFDDVWIREVLDKLMFNIFGIIIFVVLWFKLVDFRIIYEVELLNENEVMFLFCFFVFNEKLVFFGFSKVLVK